MHYGLHDANIGGMSEYIKVLFSISVSGSLLILLVLLIKQVFKTRMSARWHYYIWLLVIIRLLVPFSPWEGAAGLMFSMPSSPPYDAAESGSAFSDTGPEEELPFPGQTAPASRESRSEREALPAGESVTTSSVLSRVSILWAMIAVVFFIRKVTIYQSFQKYIHAGRQEPDDPAVLDVFSDVCERLAIRRIPRFYTNPLIASPIFSGILQPCVFLPGIPEDKVELELILIHELMHYKHKDTWFIWIVQLVLSIHWFNPLVHYLAGRLRQEREFACDEAVINVLQKEEYYTYGNVLIKSLENIGTYREAVVSVSLHESAQMLKQRLEAIHNNDIRQQRTGILPAVLTVIIVSAALLLGAYRPPGELPSIPPGELPFIPSGTEAQEAWEEPEVPGFVFTAAEVMAINITGGSGQVQIVGSETEQIVIAGAGEATAPVVKGETLWITGSDDYDECIYVSLPLNSLTPPDISMQASDGKYLLQDISINNLFITMEGGEAAVAGIQAEKTDIESSYANIAFSGCSITGPFTYSGNLADLKARQLNTGSCNIKTDLGMFIWEQGVITGLAEFDQESGGEMTLDQLQAGHMIIRNESGEFKVTACTAPAIELENESMLDAKFLTASDLTLKQTVGMMELTQIKVDHSLNAGVESGTIKMAADVQGRIDLNTRHLGKLELSIDTPRSLWNISANALYDNTLSAFFLDGVLTQYPYQDYEPAANILSVTDENSVGQFVHIRFQDEGAEN